MRIMMHCEKTFCVLVLAAGKGTRMHSNTPKVLQKILEEPILYYPLTVASRIDGADVGAVVGSGGAQVEKWLSSEFPGTEIIWQEEQLGTGHAVKLAANWWKDYKNVMVLSGDTPLITGETLKKFMQAHMESESLCSVLSFDAHDPDGYGRVLRDGERVRIVEHKDAAPAERQCREVNSGLYVFCTESLSGALDSLNRENNQKEYYLPDALGIISENGGKVCAVKTERGDELLGINDPAQLAEAAAIMQKRILDGLMRRGVRCMDPQTTWIGPKAVIGSDVTVEPGVQIWGSSRVGNCSRIGSFSVLQNAVIGDNVTVTGSVRISDSTVGKGSTIGPFVYIRENTVLEEEVSVGRFVEIKKSRVGKGSKVPHLSYIGDTVIGKGTNIGAGTITCNYDGVKKHGTIIGDNCFVGSDTILVAPVTLGNDSATGAGSVITSDVPEGALGIGRARQRNIVAWKARGNGKKGEEE